MLVASGQGLMAVINPSRKAVKRGKVLWSIRFCRNSILIADFGFLISDLALLAFASLRFRLRIADCRLTFGKLVCLKHSGRLRFLNSYFDDIFTFFSNRFFSTHRNIEENRHIVKVSRSLALSVSSSLSHFLTSYFWSFSFRLLTSDI